MFGGKSKKQETTTTSYVDYGRMVRDAEAAGFNPLTALRNGGAAGFSVSTGTTPATPLSARIADGVSGALLQKSWLVGEILFSRASHGLTFEILRVQRHYLCEYARSNAESSFDNPGFSTDVAGEIKNGSLPLA